jgi:Helix-turn-helix domain
MVTRPATATECAEIAGLSPSACSYHLRTLARHGFVEEDRASAADGRERPWRARLLAFNISEGPACLPPPRWPAGCWSRTCALRRRRTGPGTWRASLGNVAFLTVLQKRVSPGLLGRVMGVLMLYAFGSFPLSVAISGVLVHRLGPTPFFLVAGALIAVAVLGGLTQREFRTFGAPGDDSSQAARPHAAADLQAAEGSRK